MSSNSVTVVVKPSSQYVCTGYGCDVPCNSTAPGGWNTPANCQAPAPTAPPAHVTGKLTLAVGDLGSNYSPVCDPNWPPTSGEPDPCVAPTTACNSPYMAFLPTQYGLFSQHLLVQVAPPAYAPRPPDLSSPPTAYTPGVCKLYFPPSSQDFVTLPQGIAEETGQPWPTEWDPLQPVAGGIGLTGTVLVDWAWWPPLPFGTVVGPDDIVSHWVADVYHWIYHRVQVGVDSNGNPVYQWQASCDDQGLQGGETNPQVNPAQGGQVYVWGDRIVLIPVVTHELLWGWP